MKALRCPECGMRYIKEPAKRCKECARRYLDQFETDYLDEPDPVRAWESNPHKSGVRSKSFSDEIKRQLFWRKWIAIGLWVITMVLIMGGAAILAFCGREG